MELFRGLSLLPQNPGSALIYFIFYQAAAERMRDILPDMRTKYDAISVLTIPKTHQRLPLRFVRLNIPMPGHPVGDAQRQQARVACVYYRVYAVTFSLFPVQTLADIQTLRDLIAAHDVVMLLTDTRMCPLISKLNWLYLFLFL